MQCFDLHGLSDKDLESKVVFSSESSTRNMQFRVFGFPIQFVQSGAEVVPGSMFFQRLLHQHLCCFKAVVTLK